MLEREKLYQNLTIEVAKLDLEKERMQFTKTENHKQRLSTENMHELTEHRKHNELMLKIQKNKKL